MCVKFFEVGIIRLGSDESVFGTGEVILLGAFSGVNDVMAQRCAEDVNGQLWLPLSTVLRGFFWVFKLIYQCQQVGWHCWLVVAVVVVGDIFGLTLGSFVAASVAGA